MPLLRVDEIGARNLEWSAENSSESQASVSTDRGCIDLGLPLSQTRWFLDQGVHEAARKCLGVYRKDMFRTLKENMVEGGSSKVDYVGLVNDNEGVLVEAKSPYSPLDHSGK